MTKYEDWKVLTPDGTLIKYKECCVSMGLDGNSVHILDEKETLAIFCLQNIIGVTKDD